MKCLKCHKVLRKASYYGLRCFYCTDCRGVFFTLSGLRTLVNDRQLVNRLWAQAKYGYAADGKYCLCCNHLMKKVFMDLPEGGRVELDLCTGCQMVWFDAGELYEVPVYEPPEDPEKSLPPEAREKLAAARIRHIEKCASANAGEEEEVAFYKHIIACLGFPVEVDAPPLRQMPWVTWGLALICVLLFAVSVYTGLEQVIRDFGFIPAEAGRMYGVSWISSSLLHAGVMHLVGNIYFLLIFGDNTEDLLGKWYYLLLVLAAELAGNFLFFLGDPACTVPCVGASGFISGVIAFYCIALPGTRLLIRIKLLWQLQLYASGWLLIWLLGQGLGAIASGGGAGGGVAYMAHLGGATVGAAAGIWYRLCSRRRVEKATGEG